MKNPTEHVFIKKDIITSLMSQYPFLTESAASKHVNRAIEKFPDFNLKYFTAKQRKEILREAEREGFARKKKERVKFFTAWGETKTLQEWSNDPRCLVGLRALYSRVFQARWESLEEALTKPPQIRHNQALPEHLVEKQKKPETRLCDLNKHVSSKERIKSGKEWLAKFEKENNLIELEKELKL